MSAHGNEPEKAGWNFARSLPAKANSVLRSRRWQRRAAWTVGVWLLLWLLAYAAVPPILKWQLQKIASEKLGRQVTLGQVDFKPWSLELTLNDLVIAKNTAPGPAGKPAAAPGTAQPAAQSAPQLRIRRLYMDAELESLLRLAPVADAIRVEDPVVSLTHLGDGRYDIDDILDRFKTSGEQPAGKPQRFSLYNLVLSGGQFDFIDQSVHKTYELRDLNISVPFLSNLKSQREIKTAPRLSFTLNGSRFDSAAVGTPFAQTHKTDANITLRNLDLAPYLAYWPKSLPYRLQGAVLNSDIRVAFEETPATALRISGTVTADKVRLLDTRGASPGAAPVPERELLAFDRLQLTLDDVRPLEQFVKLSAVELTAPTLSVTRDRAGQLNLMPPASQIVTKNVATDSGKAKATGQKDPESQVQAAPGPASAPAPAVKTAAATPWKVQVAKVAVRGGRVNWLDETLPAPAQIRLTGLALNASAIAMPFAAGAPMQFTGSLGLEPPPASATAPGKAAASAVQPGLPSAPALISFSGTATDQAAQVSATVAAWPLNMAEKYVGQFLLPALNGRLDAQLAVNWQAGAAGRRQALQIIAPEIAVTDVLLAQGKTSLVSVKKMALAQVDIDVPGQSFKAAKMQILQPRATVERDAEKRWMYERWLVAPGLASPAPAASKAGAKAGTPSWAVAINDVELDGGALSFSDKAGTKPVAFEVSAAKARLGGLVLDDQPSGKAQGAKLMPLSASLRLATGRFQPGKVDFKGSLGLAPLQARGQLDLSRLPVQAFEAYFGGALNIDLLRADASFRGRVAYRETAAGPQAQVAGDVALEEFKANSLVPSEELLAWKTLNVRGLKVVAEPARATRVDVRETVLTDFFARVIIMPDGRINLQDLLKPAVPGDAADGSASTSPSAEASKTIAEGDRVPGVNTGKDLQVAAAKGALAVTSGSVTTSAAPVTTATPAGPQPIVNFGPVSLINGKVQFSDRFIKPNYSADLSELTGKLSAFSSVAPGTPGSGTAGAPAMADLELRGKAEGTASLEIVGKLNPLAKPLALDIKGKVRDLELPPLSPYAIKYSGYGIERGKLSVDVNYVVLPDGRLTATNKLVLNQLSFGDKVQGSTASLPVKLAVALLADRNGVIDLDLPISGSLNDPQFSLGPIIIKVILNVIGKAITAPFSLLAHALGGGGEELSMVGFPAGSAQLSAEATAGLDKVAKALVERPALRLTVVGTSSLEIEREAFKRERLGELVRAEKRRQMVREGMKADDVSVSPAQYPALLKEVYQRADIPKPRNLIGLAKDQPVPEMEKLLLASIKVSDDDMRELALQRGMAVKDYLASRGLPPERLFLGAFKAVAPQAKWTPRAELNLAMP